MKSLVTGGAGFIGSHIVDALVARGDSVVIIDSLSTGKKKNLNPRGKFIEMNISNLKIISIIENEHPDIVFHLAAQASVPVSVKDPLLDAKTNVIGLLHVLTGAIRAKTDKFVFTSTGGAIYGENDQIPTSENFNARPESPYGLTKQLGERYVEFFQKFYQIRGTVLRYANVYGPRQNSSGESGVVAIFTNLMIKGKRPTINGDGRHTRDYIFVEDVVAANLLAADSDRFGPFNIGTGIETTNLQVFEALKKYLDFPGGPIFGPERPGDILRSAVDSSKALSDLGWKPQISFDMGIKKTINYFRMKAK